MEFLLKMHDATPFFIGFLNQGIYVNTYKKTLCCIRDWGK